MIVDAVCNTYIELGVNAYKQGLHDVADKMLDAALQEAERLSTSENPSGAVFNRLAYLYYKQNDVRKAEQVYEKALDLFGRLLNCDDKQYANVMLNLADLYFSQRKYEQAAPLYERALHLEENRLGKEHESLERILLRFAWICCMQENFDTADKLYKRVREIRERMVAQVKGLAG